VVLAAVPLVTLLLAAAQRLERLSLRAVTGSVLALTGIAWMVLGSQALTAPISAVLAMLGATLAIGQSFSAPVKAPGGSVIRRRRVGRG
jgi:drug/metabolite transporter (DMT)-like permease